MAIVKALDKPQLLPYMRKKILEDIVHNLDVITDEEVEDNLKEFPPEAWTKN